ncbi:MAG: hypothetical protein WCT04_12460 [Planctomycetota bacterium]
MNENLHSETLIWTGVCYANLFQAHFCANALPEAFKQAERSVANSRDPFFIITEMAIEVLGTPVSKPDRDWNVAEHQRYPAFLSQVNYNQLTDSEFLDALYDWLASDEHNRIYEEHEPPEGTPLELEKADRRGWKKSNIGNRLSLVCASLRSLGCHCKSVNAISVRIAFAGDCLGKIAADLIWESEWGFGNRFPAVKQLFLQFTEKHTKLNDAYLKAVGNILLRTMSDYECQTAANELVAAVKSIATRLTLESNFDLFEPEAMIPIAGPNAPLLSLLPRDADQQEDAKSDPFKGYKKMTMKEIADEKDISAATVSRRKSKKSEYRGKLKVIEHDGETYALTAWLKNKGAD